MNYIKKLSEISYHDRMTVGGKAAALGQMLSMLKDPFVIIPSGFVLNTNGFHTFMQQNHLEQSVQELIMFVETGDEHLIAEKSLMLRQSFLNASLPNDIRGEMKKNYDFFVQQWGAGSACVVRSSSVGEDAPENSFAGQMDSFVGIKNFEELLIATIRCFASLFSERALLYRKQKGLLRASLSLAVIVQNMVDANDGASGVLFTLDPETGFQPVVVINAVYGFGENIVQGEVNPDEYILYKNRFSHSQFPILKKELGSKKVKCITEDAPVSFRMKKILVSDELCQQFVLSDQEMNYLMTAALAIEHHFSMVYKKKVSMDIEWVRETGTGKLYIVQARPETVHAKKTMTCYLQYRFDTPCTAKPILSGQSIGQGIMQGRIRIVKTGKETIRQGDILVTSMTSPDLMPLLMKATAIITDLGGRTCHAAIISRELGMLALIGTENGTSSLCDDEEVTLEVRNGATGYVYTGHIPFVKEMISVEAIKPFPCDIMLNIAHPDSVFSHSFLPVQGVGLARLEFIMAHLLGIHPCAVTNFEKITDEKVRDAIIKRAKGYPDLRTFFIQILMQGISKIAAAFYPRPVIVRLSDFKTNEYQNLLGGSFFEFFEENPMLGWRGASRYTDPQYKSAWLLECEALKKSRLQGFSNIHLMLPFVRTVGEAEKVVNMLKQSGLERGKDGLLFYMMVEIPSNVILLEKFSPFFDGFSIGSNDLTQLTLGVDRDSAALAGIFNERDDAVLWMIKTAIEKAHAMNKKIGICGQAPSDDPIITQFLVEQKIDSLSLNPDSILPFFIAHQKDVDGSR